MPDTLRSLKEYFFSYLPSRYLGGLAHIIDSSPFTSICIFVLLVPLGIWLLFSVVYILIFLYGLLSGHPFPSREIFLFFPGLAAVFAQPSSDHQAPFLAKVVFAYAFTGFIMGRVLQRRQQPDLGWRFLAAIGRHWNVISSLMIFSLLFATLGAGFFSYDNDSGYFLIAGIIPFSDANAFYTEYTEYFYNGLMSDHSLRRPMAAFMGAAIHWLAGNDPATSLLLRWLLLFFAMWASCAVMNKSFGVWSALSCLALEYGYCCLGKYSQTFMTEPLGFFWGGIAAALWLQALHGKRLFWNLAAFSATLIGLLTRMGAMFLLPLLFLYILWRWRELIPRVGWWKKPLLGLCLCTACIVLLNTTFAGRGVGDHQQTGSNFSYCFAGLTLGTNWYGAAKLYAKQLQSLIDEKQKSRFLYKQGIKNFLHSPAVFFKRIFLNEREFIKNFNFFLFHDWGLVCLLGMVLVIRRKILFSKATAVFWVSVWIGILLSIPFFYFDGFSRVIFFVYPLVACFFSLPLAMRQPDAGASGASPRFSAAWLAVILPCGLLLLMTSVALFPRLHTSDGIRRIQNLTSSLPELPANRFLVAGGGMGFLVVPDGEEPDNTIPSMTWSTFRDRYQKFTRSGDETLFSDGFPPPPFVVLIQIPVVGSVDGFNCFVAPPKVLTQKNVLLWDFETLKEIRDHKGSLWKIVAKAIPALYK